MHYKSALLCGLLALAVGLCSAAQASTTAATQRQPCTGANCPICPSPGAACCTGNRLSPVGTVCKSQTACLQAARCDGLVAVCPAQQPKNSSTICAGSTDPGSPEAICFPPKFCNGVNGVCPDPTFADKGTICDFPGEDQTCQEPGVCDGKGACGSIGPQFGPEGTPCNWENPQPSSSRAMASMFVDASPAYLRHRSVDAKTAVSIMASGAPSEPVPDYSNPIPACIGVCRYDPHDPSPDPVPKCVMTTFVKRCCTSNSWPLSVFRPAPAPAKNDYYASAQLAAAPADAAGAAVATAAAVADGSGGSYGYARHKDDHKKQDQFWPGQWECWDYFQGPFQDSFVPAPFPTTHRRHAGGAATAPGRKQGGDAPAAPHAAAPAQQQHAA